jgi:putative spermidine/putrescine transport system permease protein
MNRFVRWIAVIAITAGVLLPLLPLVLWSFADRWFYPSVWPEAWTSAIWRYVASPSSRVAEAMFTSTLVASAVVAICVAIGLPAARALALHDFRGRGAVEWLIMLPIIVPTLVVAMGIQIVMIQIGLADTLPGVVLVHLAPAMPYFVLVMAGVFANYSTDLEDTARTLGAPPWRTFWYVTLPAIFPGLVVAAMFTFLVSWTQYITTVLVGGGRIVTLPMVLFPLIGSANHGAAAAVSIVFVLPALVILVYAARTLHQGGAALGGFGKL